MKIRLFVEDISNDIVTISNNQHHYLLNVLRVKNGEQVFLFNQTGEYDCNILDINKKYVTLAKKQQIVNDDKLININACIPLIKPDTLSRMIRQSVELGCAKISIFTARHSCVRHVNLDKIITISIEALEQCRGLFLPEIKIYNNLQQLTSEVDNIVFANERSASNTNIFSLKNIDKTKNISVFVGPEGGFCSEEIELLSKKGTSINLGNRILRADTALVNIISIVKI